MLIRLLADFSGPLGYCPAGSEKDWPADDAARLIARGLAEPVRQITPETAVRGRGEKAVRR